MFLVVLSWSLNQCVSRQRQWTGRRSKPGPEARRAAWNIDGKFQLHRVALRSAGYYELRGGGNDVPYLEKEASLPLPFQAIERNGDTNTKVRRRVIQLPGRKELRMSPQRLQVRHTPEPALANEGNGRTEEGSRAAEETVEVKCGESGEQDPGGAPPLSKNQNSIP
jgi:hypothetical protein